MINRTAEAALLRYAKGFPVVCISGPRQSGKTTLARQTFPQKPYLSLEDPDIIALARTDPRGLLGNYPHGLILDEAQYVPELFAYLKTAVDADPVPGKYVITGSQQFHLLEKIRESLAGRAALLTLLPFSIQELRDAGQLLKDPFDCMLNGLYPPVYDRDVSPQDWYAQYITLYIERDIRSLINVKDLGQFQSFVKMCASRTGQLLNLSALAADCGITHNTAKAWVSVLETSGIVCLLRPYHRSYGKRLVKTPKLHFLDPGLVCRLLGITQREQLFLHPNRGNIFESFITAERLKTRLNAGLAPNLFFWRDNTGNEVDLIQEDGDTLQAIEIKSGQTFSSGFFEGLKKWIQFTGSPSTNCQIVYAGDISLSREGIRVISWNQIASSPSR
ncbi:ATPase [Spirochaetia bacterium]|nr:ATPase [Spirochaetia bacterium]